MSTVALEKVASDVAEGVTPQCVARLVRESRHALWREYVTGSVHSLNWESLISFSCVYLFLLITKRAPKFVKLEVYDL
jgi:hypothetical protein